MHVAQVVYIIVQGPLNELHFYNIIDVNDGECAIANYV